MENKLKIFENKEFGEIRVQEINNEPWFVGNDIASILGYKNTRDALSKHVDNEDKISDVAFYDGSQKRNMVVINESGLYSLILASKLPNAKKFKKWVTSEVLPSIRKNGMYATDNLLNNPEFAIQVFMNLKKEKEEKEKLQLLNIQSKQIIGELKPKADYTDTILQNKSLVTMTAIAKDYGMSAEKMNNILHKLGIQFKQSDQWFLYSKYHNNGYTHSETIYFRHRDGKPDTKMNTKWTQKGRLFLYNLLKSNYIVPVIEKVGV